MVWAAGHITPRRFLLDERSDSASFEASAHQARQDAVVDGDVDKTLEEGAPNDSPFHRRECCRQMGCRDATRDTGKNVG